MLAFASGLSDLDKCRLNSETVEPGNPERQVITALTYDDAAGETGPVVGHVTKVTVTGSNMPTSRVTMMSWAATGGRFLSKITNALSQDTCRFRRFRRLTTAAHRKRFNYLG